MMIIVAGITRSGLTLVMQMLNAGGFPCEGDYPSFEEHPFGEVPWGECFGKAVKLVDAHLQLPPPGNYKIVRLARNLKQQAKSFNKFTKIFGMPSAPVALLIKSFKRDYITIDKWAQGYPVLRLGFEAIILDPTKAAEKLAEFIGVPMAIRAMAKTVIKRGTDCHPTMLETEMVHR